MTIYTIEAHGVPVVAFSATSIIEAARFAGSDSFIGDAQRLYKGGLPVFGGHNEEDRFTVRESDPDERMERAMHLRYSLGRPGDVRLDDVSEEDASFEYWFVSPETKDSTHPLRWQGQEHLWEAWRGYGNGVIPSAETLAEFDKQFVAEAA